MALSWTATWKWLFVYNESQEEAVDELLDAHFGQYEKAAMSSIGVGMSKSKHHRFLLSLEPSADDVWAIRELTGCYVHYIPPEEMGGAVSERFLKLHLGIAAKYLC